MKIVTSVSGGRTSAYLAANYPADHLVFSLVRVECKKCKFPDEAVRRKVEMRIETDFVGTVEDDTIIYTILDLEQFLGKKINWVTGLTFEKVIQTKGGWLPSKLHRYCTTNMKIIPIFEWCAKNIGEPVLMNIGYRANETNRANDMLSKLNSNGILELKATIEKHEEGRFKGKNKWKTFEWQRPQFHLIEDGIYKQDIIKFWKGKPVKFADYNNCIGCFHRNVHFLNYMFRKHPNKMEWFLEQEEANKHYWKSNGVVIPYSKIKKMAPQQSLFSEDFKGCPDGYCGL